MIYLEEWTTRTRCCTSWYIVDDDGGLWSIKILLSPVSMRSSADVKFWVERRRRFEVWLDIATRSRNIQHSWTMTT